MDAEVIEEEEEDEDIDMFSAVVEKTHRKKRRTTHSLVTHRVVAAPVGMTRAEDWDDSEGYYMVRYGRSAVYIMELFLFLFNLIVNVCGFARRLLVKP